MIGGIGALILLLGLFLIFNDRVRLVNEVPIVGDTVATVIIVVSIAIIAFGIVSESFKKPK